MAGCLADVSSSCVFQEVGPCDTGGSGVYRFNPCAGVVLENYSLTRNFCYSRGETANKVVVWSQCSDSMNHPTLKAYNNAAQTALRNQAPLRAVIEAGDAQTCMVFDFPTRVKTFPLL